VNPCEHIRSHIFERFNKKDAEKNLSALCYSLLSAQLKKWEALEKTYKSLQNIMTRNIRCTGFSVLLQYNPERITSSLAGTGNSNENEHSCFLCLHNLPERQQGILYQDVFLILCNPAPVLPFHFTVAHVNHYRQDIMAHMDTFLALIADFGSQWTVLYNGPRCGASAPHHLHFQVIPSGKTPIEKEIREKERLTIVKQKKGVIFYKVSKLEREIMVIEGNDSIAIADALNEYMATLKKYLPADEEPMINIAGFFEEKRWRLIVFPRKKHRPQAFFQEGDRRVVVSPAILEMLGLIITPMKKDFEKLDAKTIEAIYNEVSLKKILPYNYVQPSKRT